MMISNGHHDPLQSDQNDRHALFDLLARVASLYYLEEWTQDKIARQLGLSRQKVQRLLHQAREQRIVEIHVHSAPVLHSDLRIRSKQLFTWTMWSLLPRIPMSGSVEWQ